MVLFRTILAFLVISEINFCSLDIETEMKLG
jgi:hypothetical protein